MSKFAARRGMELSLPGKVCVGVAAGAVFVGLVVVLALYLAGHIGVPQQPAWALQDTPGAQAPYDPCTSANTRLLPSSLSVSSFTLDSITPTDDGTADDERNEGMAGKYDAVKPMAWLSGLTGLWTNGTYFVSYGTYDGGATYTTRVETYTCSTSPFTSYAATVFYESAPTALNSTAPFGDVGAWKNPSNNTG